MGILLRKGDTPAKVWAIFLGQECPQLMNAECPRRIHREEWGMKSREELVTYIKQGQAQKKLLQLTNIHGKNQQQIKVIQEKVSKAQKKLRIYPS
jgi:hypothetical protein